MSETENSQDKNTENDQTAGSNLSGKSEKSNVEKIKEEIASKPSKIFEDEPEQDPHLKSVSNDKKSQVSSEYTEDFDEYYIRDLESDSSDITNTEQKEQTRVSLATVILFVGSYIRKLISLDEDKANEQQTIDQVKRNVVFRGTNLWILIFAILIASVGLNMNSAAVIIGAMLISPLMGPIMGIGMGVGINDLQLIRKAAKNLFVAALISILTSTLYFLITPISDAHSELLARTTPTIFDVLIAFFGGTAGIVAGSRSEKSNAIPGVAIATALMPPLCTAGYGLANGNWEYFSGALYLFFINSVFIAISTFIIVRYLKYPRKRFADPAIEKKVKVYVIVIGIITLIPSIYFAYNVVTKSFFIRNASEFVQGELNFPDTYIIGTDYYQEGDSTAIQVTLYGELVEPLMIDQAKKKMYRYNLPESCDLVIRQSANRNGLTTDDVAQINSQIRQDLMADLFKNNEEELADREQTIAKLKEELFELKRPIILSEDILNELKVNYPNITQFSASVATVFNSPNENNDDSTFVAKDTLLLTYATFKQRLPRRSDRKKLEEWLKVRTKSDKLKLIVDKE